MEARDGGAPGIALVEQGLEAELQLLFVVLVMQAMHQPERVLAGAWRAPGKCSRLTPPSRSQLSSNDLSGRSGVNWTLSNRLFEQ